MTWWILPSLLGTIISLYVTRQTSMYMRPPASVYMTAMGIMVAWWCAGQWAGLLWQNLDYRYFIAQLQYVAIASVPVLWFSASLCYSGFHRFVKRWYPLIWIPPTVTILLAFTNTYHGQLWSDFQPSPDSVGLDITYGPWFKVYAVYGYSAVTIGTVFLANRIGFMPGHRLQFFYVVSAPVVVLALNIPFIFGFRLLPIDPTPIGFAVASLILISALRHKLFVVLPIARRHILDKLDDGVITIDDHGLIADANAAAKSMLGTGAIVYGKPLSAALPKDALPDDKDDNETRLPDGRWLHIRMSPVQVLDGPAKGQIVLLRDITRDKQMQRTVERTQQTLESLNSRLQAQAHTDDLTQLANRRHLYQRMQEEWSRSERRNQPVSLILLDFDHFKKVNDTYGHQTGDRVLATAAQLIRQSIRPEDLASRHGGEELAVLLPDTELKDAVEAAQRIQQSVSNHVYSTADGQEFSVTISAGVACREPEDGSVDALVARADSALYHSKRTGRNAVSVAGHNELQRLGADDEQVSA
jgi:diguanylate cyclase (GGDEF)-like protein